MQQSTGKVFVTGDKLLVQQSLMCDMDATELCRNTTAEYGTMFTLPVPTALFRAILAVLFLTAEAK